MEVNIVIIILTAFAVSAVVGFFASKTKSALRKASEEEEGKKTLESKFASLKSELASLKDENQKKSRLLDEARENAKKRLRKDAQKAESDSSTQEVSLGSDSENLRRNLMAMENQIRSLKQGEEERLASLKASLEEDHKNELLSLKDKIAEMQLKLDQAKADALNRRQNVSKQLPEPIDLKEVPAELVSELSRLLRKNEQFEKMHGILQGKHQLAQERYQELQRRYFAVCRELALVALPQEETTDEEARQLAEKVVENSDKIVKETEAKSAAPSEA